MQLNPPSPCIQGVLGFMCVHHTAAGTVCHVPRMMVTCHTPRRPYSSYGFANIHTSLLACKRNRFMTHPEHWLHNCLVRSLSACNNTTCRHLSVIVRITYAGPNRFKAAWSVCRLTLALGSAACSLVYQSIDHACIAHTKQQYTPRTAPPEAAPPPPPPSGWLQALPGCTAGAKQHGPYSRMLPGVG